MPIVLSELRDVIRGDAELRAMASIGDDTGIALALNRPVHPVVRRISREDLVRWSAVTGAMQRLEVAATGMSATPGAPSAASAAKASLVMLSSGIAELRLDSEINQLLAILVSANVLTEADMQAMRTRATELVGFADKTWGEPVSVDQVSASLEPDRPDGMVGELL